MRLAACAISLLLTGCLGAVLEAPFVLASGLGEVRGLSPSSRHTLLAATADGVLEISAEGRVTRRVSGVDARAVAAHRERLYVLDDDGIRYGALHADGQVGALGLWGRPGIRDIAAGCSETVLFADAEGVGRWVPGSDATGRLGPRVSGVRALALDPLQPCEGVLVLTEEEVRWVTEAASVPVVAGLSAPQAFGIDRWGGVWVVEQDPPVLVRRTRHGPEVRARFLGPTSDLLFGPGDLLHPANAYLSGPEGTLDYARVVPDGERIRAPRPLSTALSGSPGPP